MVHPTASGPIREYILANRRKYTRGAIGDQLRAAGHDQAAIDEVWRVVDADPTLSAERPPSRAGIVVYVLIWYLLGALITLGMASGSGLGWFPPIYLVVGGLVAYGVTRIEVTGWGWLLALPLVPICFFFVWYGTCVAAYSINH